MKTASWYYSFATDPLDQLKCVLSLDKIALLLKGFLSFLLSTDGNAIQGVGYSHFIVMYTYCQKTIIRSLSYNSVSSHKMKVFTLLLMVLVSVKICCNTYVATKPDSYFFQRKQITTFLSLLMIKSNTLLKIYEIQHV